MPGPSGPGILVIVGQPSAIGRQGVTSMTNNGSDDVQLNRGMIVGGGVLVALGSLLGFTGMALLMSALISATRRWVDHMEQPPGDVARRKWQQTKAAASAGAAAWRDGPSSS
jgi:hypothetical protein